MDDAAHLAPADLALAELLRRLEDAAYDFVTPTPLTHARVVRRPDRQLGHSLRDILGWSLPFRREDAPGWLVAALDAADELAADGERLKSRVRVSRLHDRLFLHAAYPAKDEDAVFLGPDSYRFADFLVRELSGDETGLIVDVGGGGGVGAIVAAGKAPGAELLLTDVNPTALRYARINAAQSGVRVRTLLGDGLADAPQGLQAVLANPPYIAATDQTYSDGGGMHGGRISLDWARQALARLAPGGRLLLYTGSAILDGGGDPLREALAELAAANRAGFSYREIDPDVFGEELERETYADVERIAAVGCVIARPG